MLGRRPCAWLHLASQASRAQRAGTARAKGCAQVAPAPRAAWAAHVLDERRAGVQRARQHERVVLVRAGRVQIWRLGRRVLRRGRLEQRGDVGLLEAAVAREKFEAVAVVGQVRGGDHDRAVELVPCRPSIAGVSRGPCGVGSLPPARRRSRPWALRRRQPAAWCQQRPGCAMHAAGKKAVRAPELGTRPAPHRHPALTHTGGAA